MNIRNIIKGISAFSQMSLLSGRNTEVGSSLTGYLSDELTFAVEKQTGIRTCNNECSVEHQPLIFTTSIHLHPL